MEDIFKAIFREDKDFLEKNINRNTINIQDKDGRTPLIHAVVDDKLNIIKLLVEKGADINIQDSVGYTALHYASQNFSLETLKILLDNGAKIDIQDVHGNTPLFRAVFNSKGRGEVINLLLEYGANKYIENKYGVSPLKLSETIGNYDVKQFLV